MIKKKLNNLDLDVYEEKLDNGLMIYVIPFCNKKGIYATFTTKFGANILEFIPKDSKEYKKMPPGIAHFLEHKVFAQEDGIEPFTFYSKNGADSNAFTNYNQTTYLFEGPDQLVENLNFLLDFVQSPYFTDENVEKEKGIIEQEIKMYADNPYVAINERINSNTFTTSSYKHPVAGTVDDIYKITKEDLYECYDTFYNPSNMFIVVTGNVDPVNVINIIKSNQDNKNIESYDEIKTKLEIEEDTIPVSYDEIEKNISLPKTIISYKFNKNALNDFDDVLKSDMIASFFYINFGYNSKFFEKMEKENILNFPPSIRTFETKTHIVCILSFETLYSDLIIKNVNKIIKRRKISKIEFNRFIKDCLCSLLYMSDSFMRINKFITSSVIDGSLDYDIFDKYKYADYDKVLYMLKELNFDNKSILKVNIKEQ